MRERYTFNGKTVVLAGAGCPAGDALASGFASAGARVVAIDRNECRVLDIAARDPERIDPLRLDILDPDQTALFANIWQDEPLNVLIHLQPLRHINDLAKAIPSVLSWNNRLSPGLKAGQSRVVVLFQDMPDAAKPRQRAFLPALERLARTLQSDFEGTGVTVNAVRLPAQSSATITTNLLRVVTWLTGPPSPHLSGSLLGLQAQGD
ncbi:hypothetical protein [Roseovarius sp. 2305UL8-3]|uniref:hypothetical protein n=1 Tax=Roseovarius conchicola TaxID=3121636 RepID=UPI0035299061